jgi:hypothetical protein
MARANAGNFTQQGARHRRHGRYANAPRRIRPGRGSGFGECCGEIRILGAEILRTMIELQLAPFRFNPSRCKTPTRAAALVEYRHGMALRHQCPRCGNARQTSADNGNRQRH